MNPHPFTAGSSRRSGAFTLVELLVTMTVSLVLIIFLFQLFNASMQAWRSGENQNDTYREARAAMQIMVRDLSQTIKPLPVANYTSTGLTTSAAPIVPVLVLDRYPDPVPELQKGDEINEEAYCLATIPNGGASSLCGVGYYCLWMPELARDKSTAERQRAPRAFALMRQYLGSGSPAVAADPAKGVKQKATVPGLFDRFQVAKGKDMLSFLDVYERTPPPTTPRSPVATAGVTELASYIWDLQFRTSDTLQTLVTPPVYGVQPPYPKALPAYVEIRFKALSAGAARQLESLGSVDRTTWKDSGSLDSIYRRVILPGTRQFVTRAPIYTGSATAAP